MSKFFRHYPGMNLIDQSCTAQIFFLLSKQPARFNVVCVRCSSDLPIKPRFHQWNAIIRLVRSFEKPRYVRPEGPFLCFLCRGTSDPGYDGNQFNPGMSLFLDYTASSPSIGSNFTSVLSIATAR